MPINPPGPYLFVIQTVTDGLAHDITINCDVLGTPTPGTNPIGVTLRNKGGGGVILSGAADAFWTATKNLFGASTLASTYTLYKLGVTNNEREFVSAGTLTSPNGGFGAYVPAQQLTYTWRGAKGGIAKLQLMEVNETGNSRVPTVSSGSSTIKGLNTYIMSDDSFLMARERSFPVASMNASLGQNEKIFTRRFRS